MKNLVSRRHFIKKVPVVATSLAVLNDQLTFGRDNQVMSERSLIIDSHSHVWPSLYDICEWDFATVEEYYKYIQSSIYAACLFRGGRGGRDQARGWRG